jgi:hypothetical protein
MCGCLLGRKLRLWAAIEGMQGEFIYKYALHIPAFVMLLRRIGASPKHF